MSDLRSHIKRAVDQLGGQRKLALAAGVSQQMISAAATGAAARLSPESALKISKATGGNVRIADLLPDVAEAVRQELSAEIAPENSDHGVTA